MIKLISISSILAIVLLGCSPDVGTKEWCKELKEKPKGEWTANELGNYTKHCIF